MPREVERPEEMAAREAEERLADPEFAARMNEILERDKELLDRLADS
jgi:hypothetical protein